MTDPLLSLWQGQAIADDAQAPIALDEIKRRSHILHRRAKRRDLFEYAAGIFVLILFGGMVFALPIVSVKIGSVAIMIGIVFTLWNLHRRRSSAPDFATMTGRQCSDYHRAQLVHQRDMLHSVWRWYLGPLIPGMVIFIGAIYVEVGHAIGWMKAAEGIAPIAAAIFGFFGFIHLLNRWAARKLQHQIDRLE